MKDPDFSWKGKGELKPSSTENPHKICKILTLKVVQCGGSLPCDVNRVSQGLLELG